MATIYAVPEGLSVPSMADAIVDGRYDYARATASEGQFLARLRAWLAEAGYEGEGVGEVLRFPIADGYACYMVARVSPPALIHLPLGDAWEIPAPYARGLRARDVREEIRRQRAIATLFSSRGSTDPGA
jgi:hypothetical protein